MINRIAYLIGGLLVLCALAITIFALSGCIQKPLKADYAGKPDSCFLFSECMYLNSKNPDKNVCSDYAKECRAYGRFEFCKKSENLPDGMRFQECWDKLNSK